jgi:L-lysine exporter family protein LysE/ArgO
MISPFLNGFFLGFSLIFALGAQNVFVLRQGIIKRHVFLVALFCSLSDALLICVGVFGLSFVVVDTIGWLKPYLFIFASFWLFSYGLMRLKSAIFIKTSLILDDADQSNFWSTISILFFLTFANPHVYLDTVVLLGTVSIQYESLAKVAYVLGASFASFTFFFSLAYGSRLLLPLMSKQKSWKIFDFCVSIVMFGLAALMLNSSEIFH